MAAPHAKSEATEAKPGASDGLPKEEASIHPEVLSALDLPKSESVEGTWEDVSVAFQLFLGHKPQVFMAISPRIDQP